MISWPSSPTHCLSPLGFHTGSHVLAHPWNGPRSAVLSLDSLLSLHACPRRLDLVPGLWKASPGERLPNVLPAALHLPTTPDPRVWPCAWCLPWPPNPNLTLRVEVRAGGDKGDQTQLLIPVPPTCSFLYIKSPPVLPASHFLFIHTTSPNLSASLSTAWALLWGTFHSHLSNWRGLALGLLPATTASHSPQDVLSTF